MKDHSREIGHEEKLRVYAKNRYLNKIIYGGDRRLMEDENINLQVELSADLDDCYLLVTGMKRWQLDLIPEGQYRYFDLAPAMSNAVYGILEQCGYQGDYTYMDPTQEICILFSPKAGAQVRAEAGETAEKIQEQLNRILQKKICSEQLCCFTVYGGHVDGYERLAERFRQTTRFHELSFFDMRPMVLSEERLAARRVPYSFQAAAETLKILERMLETGEEDEGPLSELFLVRLKQSYDFKRYDEVTAELKRIFWEFHHSYGAEGEFPWQAFERHRYARLEDAFDVILGLWRECHRLIRESETYMSYVTRNAVLYIKNHFNKGITAQDVADFVHVSPSHLSHTFNREMRQSIPAFLVFCRIQESKRLLRETDLRVGDVAARVGIENISYFLRLFKRQEGMTPQEYRCGRRKIQ